VLFDSVVGGVLRHVEKFVIFALKHLKRLTIKMSTFCTGLSVTAARFGRAAKRECVRNINGNWPWQSSAPGTWRCCPL